MDYQKIYDKIIRMGQNDEFDEYYTYFESHHILPRSEGGSNKKTNKVLLPARYHHVCHLLLIKLGKCLKYCYRHMSAHEYIKIKDAEKVKIGTRKSRKMYKEYCEDDYEDKFNCCKGIE